MTHYLLTNDAGYECCWMEIPGCLWFLENVFFSDLVEETMWKGMRSCGGISNGQRIDAWKHKGGTQEFSWSPFCPSIHLNLRCICRINWQLNPFSGPAVNPQSSCLGDISGMFAAKWALSVEQISLAEKFCDWFQLVWGSIFLSQRKASQTRVCSFSQLSGHTLQSNI